MCSLTIPTGFPCSLSSSIFVFCSLAIQFSFGGESMKFSYCSILSYFVDCISAKSSLMPNVFLSFLIPSMLYWQVYPPIMSPVVLSPQAPSPQHHTAQPSHRHSSTAPQHTWKLGVHNKANNWTSHLAGNLCVGKRNRTYVQNSQSSFEYKFFLCIFFVVFFFSFLSSCD